ncbi:hypothetical protein MTR_2g064220 [Medicago truncatula]|uniref:Uncharacterized protein n=1 Tax=Medicago truncatula TaxID=3880 RepID=G7IGX3_MEDTR|nr:hypothetical protein MTR_2g064220 [Medicago truncatula]
MNLSLKLVELVSWICSFNMVNICLTFNFVGIEDFLISIEGFRQDGNPSAHNQKFDRTRLRVQSRRIQAIKAGKHNIKLKSSSLGGNAGTSGCPKWRKC